MRKKDRERINKYIKIDKNGCWTWKGCINNNQVPVIFIYGKTTSVKRLLFCDGKYATIPAKLKVRNTCSNPLCVNPDHIEEVKIYRLNLNKDFLKEVEEKCEKKRYCWIWPNKELSFYARGQKKNLLTNIFKAANNKTNTRKIIQTCKNPRCCNPKHLQEDTIHGKDIPLNVAGKKYTSLTKAGIATGVPRLTLKKHLFNGVFDIKTYRDNCLRLGKVPRV